GSAGNGRAARWNAMGGQPIGLLRIDALSGGERKVRLRYELGVGNPPGEAKRLCASTDLRLARDGWYLDRPPTLDPGPCPQAD
ncbi:MAG TPA: hypothetical protein VLM91_19890, partial [Candidatus Methylomirabilis sp.]|nr:hypothetical protein [Candidatus Methylomirabilis sp.]